MRLQARAHFYLALSAEAMGSGGAALAALRPRQLAAYRTACLRHDELGQASLLNLLLRGHIACGEFDAARALLSKTKFPEAASAAQLVRFLFYSGRVRAVLLEYSEAFSMLQQAARKAPPGQAAFVSAVTAFMVVTQLLMGEVPERATFNGKPALSPYLALARAVREGSLPRFRAAVAAHAAAFARHGTLSLVRRLDANVIRAGLRRVAAAYSCIRFADVAVKLRLGSAEDAEFLCAKAVRDGVLDAMLDNTAGTLVSRAAANPYNSSEPQAAFHRRISFLLDVHHEAQRSMRYPAKAARPDLETAEERRKREEEEQDLLERIDKGELDDDDDD
jgi:26S proteasome regulatory subunit N3